MEGQGQQGQVTGMASENQNQAMAPRPAQTMDIGAALDVLRRGGAVTRRGWNGRSQHLMLQRPDECSKMTLPYIYIRTVQNDLVPWLASQTDLLANDWVEVALMVGDR